MGMQDAGMWPATFNAPLYTQNRPYFSANANAETRKVPVAADAGSMQP
jgi:hypothetical protein